VIATDEHGPQSQHPDGYVTHREFDLWRGLHDQVHDSETEAVSTARDAMNRRLDGMNEFRDTLKDQQASFLTRQTYELRHEDLVHRIEAAEKMQTAAMARLEGRTAATSWFVPNGPAVASMLLAVCALLVALWVALHP
jgi:hypothetical protein